MPWQKRNGVAVDIELTAYALLTLAAKKDRTDGVQVLKWVTEQRNPDGGFSSTQVRLKFLSSSKKRRREEEHVFCRSHT